MTTQYAKLQPKVFPNSRPDVTPETKYWSMMLRPVVSQHLAKITRLEFCPVSPFDFIMASSTKVNKHKQGFFFLNCHGA